MQLRRFNIRGRRVPVPTVGTNKAEPQLFDYVKGKITGLPNDLQPLKSLREVIDMRFKGIGKYETRKGADPYTVAVGQAVNVEVTATTGAADTNFSTTTYLAQKVTAAASGILTAIDVNIKSPAASTGTVMVEFRADSAGSPGAVLSTSSITRSDITTSYAYKTTYSMQAPTVTNGVAYWVVVYMQDSGTGNMNVSSTTSATTAKVSSDAGNSWTATSYALNVKVYTSTAGGVRGLTRVYRPSGEGTTFFAHGTSVYKVNDTTGAITAIDTSLPAGTSRIRFDYVNDTLYYTDNVGKPRKYDWTASSTVTTSPKNATNLMNHAGLMFYFHLEDPTSVFFSNFGEYETFTSTDFVYADAPKKSDHLKAMAKLNGVLYMFTRKNKYMLLGQDNATFRVEEAYDQKGTFSQESVVYDEDMIYFASDDGVYKFNGTSAKNIIENILDDYTGLLYKDDIHLQLHNNRLFIWYRPNGSAEVNKCIVYNTLYDVIESIDENTYVGMSFARHDTGDKFIQASNRAGVLYYGEQATNTYHNLGAPLNAQVKTAYEHFGSPQRKKRITYWRPIIETVAGAYSMQCGFAGDYSDDVTYTNANLQGTGVTYDSADAIYDLASYAAPATSVNTNLNTFGEHYRWQRVYKHHAAREPFIFAGEELKIETQRLR